MDLNVITQYQGLLISSSICGIVAFLITFLSMPRLIRKLKGAEIVGRDIHKPSKPLVAEMGGIGILFGFAIGMFLGVYLYPQFLSLPGSLPAPFRVRRRHQWNLPTSGP